jgi:threonyl-tRNA synthetase
MAMAVQRLFKGAQVTIGPWIERGFYYDFDIKEPLSDKDLKAIKKEMAKIIRKDLPFVREEVGCGAGRGGVGPNARQQWEPVAIRGGGYG